MNKKKYNAVLVTTILICTQFIALCFVVNPITSQGLVFESDDSSTCLRVLPVNIDSMVRVNKPKNLGILDDGESPSFYDNIIVSADPGNESYPSMVINEFDALIGYEYEENNKSYVYLRNSQDYGQTWADPVFWDLDVNAVSPSLTIKKDTYQAYGTFVSSDSTSEIYELDIGDISNSNTWQASFTDWSNVSYNSTSGESYGFWDFSNPDITCYSSSDYPWVIGLVGSTNYTDESTGLGPCTDSLMFTFKYPGNPAYRTIVWFPNFQNCSNMSMKLGRYYDSPSDQTIYGICEIENGTNQDLLFFNGNPDVWYYEGELPLNNQIFSGSESLTHPQIFVINDHEIYIVAETDYNGNNEIILFSSPNGGENWTRSNITADILYSEKTPKYPAIFADETSIYCTFVESGNLSITSSPINEINWSAPVQLNSVNGSVVEEYRYADLSDVDHIVWTDNRNGNNDLYAVSPSVPTSDLSIIPESIRLTKGIRFLPTKNRVTYTINNLGTGYAEDVYISINYTCDDGSSASTLYQGYIAYIAGSGGEYTLSTPLFELVLSEYIQSLINFAGIETIIIEVDPDGATGDTNTANNVASISVSYGDIFPRLAGLEDFFKRFK